LAFASVQSDFAISLKPVPLQLFMPLQLFLADLQSDMPLQEFTPVQCMVAASAATDTVANPEVNNIAAAAAMVALDSLLICMIVSSIVIELNAAILLLPYKDPANAPIITQSSKLMLTSIVADTRLSARVARRLCKTLIYKDFTHIRSRIHGQFV
jgi:hypothetical protein